ncbi:hypothetical protein [Paenibacillus daejeonensis]|uniref:hypothetical protein n=1 Tax=Paenibacillus daejeonensis TaxID=135193 RepID=UPI00037570DE|nr:hypothetical protein [Paenibacillus daejeonensis]
MSVWEVHGIESKIRDILSNVEYLSKSDHHFGTPFLTAYQIAIELNDRFPEIASELRYQVGGQGTNEKNSLAQYLALQLSRYIKSGKILDIEGAFLSNNNLDDISFSNNATRLVSSLTRSQYDLSMYRFIK